MYSLWLQNYNKNRKCYTYIKNIDTVPSYAHAWGYVINEILHGTLEDHCLLYRLCCMINHNCYDVYFRILDEFVAE